MNDTDVISVTYKEVLLGKRILISDLKEIQMKIRQKLNNLTTSLLTIKEMQIKIVKCNFHQKRPKRKNKISVSDHLENTLLVAVENDTAFLKNALIVCLCF